MKKAYKFLVVFLVVFLFLPAFLVKQAHAASCTWTGATDSSWNDATNWSGCGGNIPGVGAGIGDDVIFDGGTSNVSVTIDTSPDIGSFTMESDYTGTVTAGANTVTVSGNWDRSGGTFAAVTSTVVFDGVSQTITGATTFNNFTADQSLSNDSTDQNFYFQDSITQTISGALTLNGLDSDDMINVQSTKNFIKAFLNVNGATVTADYVDVKDNYLLGRTTEVDPVNSTNSGNTFNWLTQDPRGDGAVDSTEEINSTTTNGPSLDDNDRYGISVANIGDLDGDGVQDLVVGAYWDDSASGSNSGSVSIHYMNTDGSVDSTVKIDGTTTNGPSLVSNSYYGISVASIGDLDGDGVQDLVVGAYGSQKVFIHFMNTNGTIDSTVEINSSTPNGPSLVAGDGYGSFVTNIGDLDGDGVQDLVVGAYADDAGAGNAGAIHIHFMNTDGSIDSTVEINGTTTNGPSTSGNDYYGFSADNLGDLDGDGVQDLAVGAYGDNTNRGAVHIHFMNTDGSVDSTTEINSSTTNGPTLAGNDYYGISIANLGDLDGDGVQDLAVGAYGDNGTGTDQGAMNIHFMNTDGSLDSTVEINGASTNGPTLNNIDGYGVAVACVGDLNGDGLADLVSGAWRDGAGGTDRGAVHVHFLRRLSLSGTVYSDTGITTIADGTTVELLVNGVSVGSDTTSSGAFEIVLASMPSSGDILTLYLNTGGGANGVTVTKYDGTTISGFDIYQDYLIVRTEDGTALTNANLDSANDGDSDITAIYADGGGTSLDLAGSLFIWSGDEYAPGGTVNVAGDWNNQGTFTHGSSLVTFDASLDHAIAGDTTFATVNLSETSDNSTDSTITFENGSTTTIATALIMDGLDANDRLNIISDSAGTAATIDFTGAATFSGDYLDITDNTASDNSTNISLPINPDNSISASNNATGWFSLEVTYDTGSFSEASDNDGSITDVLSMTLIGTTFTPDAVSANHVVASNVPAGLSANFTRVSDTEITLNLTGNASNHSASDGIANLTVAYDDNAFNGTNAASVTGSTKSNLAIVFLDPTGGGDSYTFPIKTSMTVVEQEGCTSSEEVSIVQIRLQGTNVYQYVIGDNQDFIGSDWQFFSGNEEIVSWTFGVTGNHTLYARFKSSSNNQSNTYSVTVAVDSCEEDNELEDVADIDNGSCGLPPDYVHGPGAAIKSPQSPKVYLISHTGEKRWMVNPDVYFTMFDSWDDYTLVSQEEIDMLCNGEDILLDEDVDNEGAACQLPSGFLHEIGAAIKDPDSPKIYLVANTCEKRWLVNEVAYFELFDSWDDYVEISEEQLEMLPEGEVISAKASANKALDTTESELSNMCTGSIEFVSSLSYGSEGEEVLALQKLLLCLGYFPSDVATVQYFGYVTQDSVANFQSANGIEPVGFVGPVTRAALNQYSNY